MLALQFADEQGLTPASTNLSFVRDIAVVGFGSVGFVLFCYLIVTAASNAVNLTDGLDGLAAGISAMVLGDLPDRLVLAVPQRLRHCRSRPAATRSATRSTSRSWRPRRMGACIGFLWWNAAPARIFMGDTGSLALGGLFAGLAMVTRTELLLVVLGGVFVVEALSVVLQVAVFRTTRRRLFRMAPFHHHFELAGLGRDHGDHPVLAARGHLLRAGCWGCSTASGWPRRAAELATTRVSPARTCWSPARGAPGASVVDVLLEVGATVTVADADPTQLDALGDRTAAVHRATSPTAARRVRPRRHQPRLPPRLRRWRWPRAAAAVPDGRRARAGVAAGADPTVCPDGPPRWLAVTGTNGKTTTTGMLEAILRAAGEDAVACGNIGLPDRGRAARRAPGARRRALELPARVVAVGAPVRRRGAQRRRRPPRLARLDGRLRARRRPGCYAARSPSRASTTARAADAAARRARAAPRRVHPRRARPGRAGHRATRRARRPGLRRRRGRGGTVLAALADVAPPGPPGEANALAAAALARAHGVPRRGRRRGAARLRARARTAVPSSPSRAGCAGSTTPRPPTRTRPRPPSPRTHRVVWVAGGLLKGAEVDDLVVAHRDRLAGAVRARRSTGRRSSPR